MNTFIEKSIEIEKNIKDISPKVKTEELSKESLKKLNAYVHKQGVKYLKNLNDFNIAESYGIDEDRQLKYEKKSLARFNCLTDKTLDVNPGTYSIDKWSKFYEKYDLIVK